MTEKTTEKPSVTLPGTVEKIIESPHPSMPEKAEIAVEGADELYQEIRIENTLTDGNGDEVKLKEGAQVEVTVEAERAATKATATMPRCALWPSDGSESSTAVGKCASLIARRLTATPCSAGNLLWLEP